MGMFPASAGMLPSMAVSENSRTTAALSDIELISEPGFSETYNRYAWSMTVFKNRLYVGTWNTSGPTFHKISHGTQVLRYTGGTEWETVLDGGLNNTDNTGLRTMIVWDDPDDDPDKGPAIYGTTMNEVDGLEVWRTFDGDDWEAVVGGDAPYPNGFDAGRENDSGRGMAIFNAQGKQWLYLGTHRRKGAEIWRTDDGITWEKVADASSLGLSKRTVAMATMCVFQDDPDKTPALFIGTWGLYGFDVIKTYDGIHFEIVATRGIHKKTNKGATKLIAFDGKLWVLCVNYIDGFDIYTAGPGVIDGNEDWELYATNGLTDNRNNYAWNAIVYDNGTGPRLYIGTFNLRHGCMLYSINSDLEYAVEVGTGSEYPNGLVDAIMYGARSFAIYNNELVIGLASLRSQTTVWTAR